MILHLFCRLPIAPVSIEFPVTLQYLVCSKNTLRFQNKRCDHANSHHKHQLLPSSSVPAGSHIFAVSSEHFSCL